MTQYALIVIINSLDSGCEVASITRFFEAEELEEQHAKVLSVIKHLADEFTEIE